MALINFNELTEFALRLVNLYYHNMTLERTQEPMSKLTELGERAYQSAILFRSRWTEVRY